MKIAVVGSRTFPDLTQVVDFVRELPLDAVVVSGGARGVDQAAEWAAKARELPEPEIFLPEIPECYGYRNTDACRREIVQALMARNTLIAEAADEVHAFFPIGRPSNGTFDTVLKAKRLRRYVVVHWEDGTSKPLPGLGRPLWDSLRKFVYYWEKEGA